MKIVGMLSVLTAVSVTLVYAVPDLPIWVFFFVGAGITYLMTRHERER